MRRGIFSGVLGSGFKNLDSVNFVVGSQHGSSDFLVQVIRKYSCHAYAKL